MHATVDKQSPILLRFGLLRPFIYLANITHFVALMYFGVWFIPNTTGSFY